MAKDILLDTPEKVIAAATGPKPDEQPMVLDIVGTAEKCWKSFDDQNRDYLEKAATGYAFCEGEQNKYFWNDKRLIIDEKAEKDKELVKDSFNDIRDNYLQWAGLIKGGYPVYRCEATNPENPNDVETARIINGVHKYHYDYVWHFDLLAHSKISPGIFKGGQVYNLWYAGKSNEIGATGKQLTAVIKNRLLSVFSVAPVGQYETSLSECSMVLCELCLPVSSYCEMFPAHAVSIRAWVKEARPSHSNRQTREMQYLGNYGLSAAFPHDGLVDDDKELISTLLIHRPCSEFPKGHQWLVIDNLVRAEADLASGVMPIEVWSTVEKHASFALRLSPAFEGVPAQILSNDMLNAMRKKAVTDANLPRVEFEDTIVSEKSDNNILILRANRDLLGQGVSPKDQVPYQLQPTSWGVAPEMLSIAGEKLRTAMHLNAEMVYEQPSGVSGERLKVMGMMQKEKLSPGQTILENGIFNSFMLASIMMQEILQAGDTFVICNAGKTETYVWKKENIPAGLNHTFISQIGQPTTSQEKLQRVAMIMQLFPQYGQIMDREDLIILGDFDGLGMRSGRNPEIELAEYENRKIQNGELKEIKVSDGIPKYIVEGYEPRPEQDDMLHLKILSRLKVGKIWNTLSRQQQEAVDHHGGCHIIQDWLKKNNQAGMFGQMPPAKMDIQLWAALGVDIPPKIQDMMKVTGQSYLSVISSMQPPAVDEEGKPLPPEGGPPPSPEVEGGVDMEPRPVEGV